MVEGWERDPATNVLKVDPPELEKDEHGTGANPLKQMVEDALDVLEPEEGIAADGQMVGPEKEDDLKCDGDDMDLTDNSKGVLGMKKMYDGDIWNAWKGFSRMTVGKDNIEKTKSCMTGKPLGSRLTRKKNKKNDGRSQMKICTFNGKMILGLNEDSKNTFKTKKGGPKSFTEGESS